MQYNAYRFNSPSSWALSNRSSACVRPRPRGRTAYHCLRLAVIGNLRLSQRCSSIAHAAAAVAHGLANLIGTTTSSDVGPSCTVTSGAPVCPQHQRVKPRPRSSDRGLIGPVPPRFAPPSRATIPPLSLLFLRLEADRLCGRLSPFTTREEATMDRSPKDAEKAAEEIAAYLDMPPERRALAKAHAAMLSRTAARVALDLPMSADVDDFRRVLAAGAKP